MSERIHFIVRLAIVGFFSFMLEGGVHRDPCVRLAHGSPFRVFSCDPTPCDPEIGYESYCRLA